MAFLGGGGFEIFSSMIAGGQCFPSPPFVVCEYYYVPLGVFQQAFLREGIVDVFPLLNQEAFSISPPVIVGISVTKAIPMYWQ